MFRSRPARVGKTSVRSAAPLARRRQRDELEVRRRRCVAGPAPRPHDTNGFVSATARFQPPPEGNQPMGRARPRSGHRVERVVRRENVRQLRQQKSEVHEVSPASCGRNMPKHALTETAHLTSLRRGERLPGGFGQTQTECEWAQRAYGITVTVWHFDILTDESGHTGLSTTPLNANGDRVKRT